MGVSSLPKTVTRQRRGCDLNQGPSAPESSTLTTRLPSHPVKYARAYSGGCQYTRPAVTFPVTLFSPVSVYIAW